MILFTLSYFDKTNSPVLYTIELLKVS
jgi:hypothetical protein